VFGEVGLAGEIRAVPMCEQRLAEAARLGFKRAVLPAQNAARIETRAGMIDSGLQLVPVDRLVTALAEL
jgi:DNA repair protein RadA/Sms